ncbi:MAG: hypothetical protein Q9159_003802 [Coniocarpon cinnabarinum]
MSRFMPVQHVNVLGKRKRGSSNATSSALPQPVSIPPTQNFNGNDGLWSTFPLRIGHPFQDALLLPSTASPNVWVSQSDTACPDGIPVPPATGHPSCADSRGRLFEANASLTWTPNNVYTLGVEANLGMDSAPTYGYDDIVIGMAGSGGPTAEHQVIADNADPRYWVGVLGLNPQPINFTDFVSPQPSLIQTLKTTNKIPSISYGYTAGAYYRNNHALGSLTLGGYDTGHFIQNEVSIPLGADTSRDLVASIQDIKTNSSTDSLLPGGSIYSFVDSTISWIYLPIDACRAFEKAFGLVWNPDWELYLVNDTLHDSLIQSQPSVTFTVGSQQSGGQTVDIELPYAAFDLNISYPFINSSIPPYLSTARYYPLKRAANDTQYTLGRAFLQEAYLITDYEHRNFSLSSVNFTQYPQSNLETIYPSGYEPQGSDGSSLGAGAIAGIVVGIVTLIAILAALVYFIRRYNQMKRQADASRIATRPTSGEDSDEYYNVDRKSGIALPPVRHPGRHYAEADTTVPNEMMVPGKYGTAYGDKPGYYGSQEIYGAEVAKELPSSEATWEADSSVRYELPGSDAPIALSEKLGGARHSGQSHARISSQDSAPPTGRSSERHSEELERHTSLERPL